MDVTQLFGSMPAEESGQQECTFEGQRCAVLVGPHGLSLAFQFACRRVAEAGGDAIAFVLCQQPKPGCGRMPPLFADGVSPPQAVLRRVLIRFVSSESETRDALARIHQLPSPPCAIVLAEWSSVMNFATDRAQTAALALLQNALHWITTIAKRDCYALICCDAPTSAAAASVPLRWIPLHLDVIPQQDQDSRFVLTNNTASTITVSFTFDVSIATDAYHLIRIEHQQ